MSESVKDRPKKSKVGHTLGKNGKYLTGRPIKEFKQDQFEELCKIQCTQEEICAVLNMSVDTLNERIKETYGQEYTFSKVYPILSTEGKISLRRAQMRTATEKDNPTMQKWLGMNMLGQTDKVESTVKEKIVYVSDYADLKDDELEKKIAEAEKELGISEESDGDE